MSPKSVLVVDDNPTNVKLLDYLLRHAGHEVATANDMTGTLAAIDLQRPNLILLDLQLPDCDGLVLASRIKMDPAMEGIPVVAVTARAMKGDRDRALDAGCDGYISKPIDTHTFLDVIARYLGRDLRRNNR